ncbi:MAG: NADH:ubiquinone oxidoreductase subunit NDUFA12 [Rhodospirillaceae bacterium]|nr:NADH:ubiquinone oxidoreductase subunit NDUFA12 [Rhodospirillaceae bacterium]
MSIGTKLFTMLNGVQVGTDSQGNKYYREKRPQQRAKERRWVVYHGKVEASLVPPAWHSWLHHTTEDVPSDDAVKQWHWQTEHVPNLTGTPNAYRPPGHLLKGGERDAATGDYEPWQPY